MKLPSGHSSLREQALDIWHSGLEAVDAYQLVHQNVQVNSVTSSAIELQVGDAPLSLNERSRLIVVGAGKAAGRMAAGFEAALGTPLCKRLRLTGWLNVPEGCQYPDPSPQFLHLEPARPAALNEPTERGVLGTGQILQLVKMATADDVVVALLSGGGSALLPLPCEGVTLQDKLAVTRHLSAAGANINQLNTVRKHLSAIKGGKLAAACGHSPCVTLVISDVLGDPLDLIASGPTVPDTSRPSDALALLKQFDSERRLPSAVYRVLEKKATQIIDVLPRPQDHITVIGNNAVAVDCAGVRAEQLGYSHAMTAAKQSEGSAEAIGVHLAHMTLNMLRLGDALDEADRKLHPNCLITGGEPTVSLVPPDIRGKGGRNQQLVLAALNALQQLDPPLPRELRSKFVILSAGTDGEDGPTDAAGALLDGQVWSRAEELQLDAANYLQRNDAYHFFQQTGGLIVTGPTGTNVCDLRVVVVDRS